jgi:hypothetical protein
MLAIIDLFYYFNPVLVSVVVIFLPGLNGWLVLLAIEMLYAYRLANSASSPNMLVFSHLMSVQVVNTLISSVVAMVFCLLAYFQAGGVYLVALVGTWALIVITQLLYKVIFTAFEKLSILGHESKDNFIDELWALFDNQQVGDDKSNRELLPDDDDEDKNVHVEKSVKHDKQEELPE